MASGLPLGAMELVERELIGDARIFGPAQPDLCRAASDNNDWRAFALLCLFDHKRVVDEVAAALLQLVPPELARHKQIDEGQFRAPFALYPQKSAERFVEISCSLSETQLLIANSASWKIRPPLHIRPGYGRVRLLCTGRDEALSVLEQLRRFCISQKLSLNAAYIDPPAIDSFRLPLEDQAASQITLSLKERFDPSRCMNPFAHF